MSNIFEVTIVLSFLDNFSRIPEKEEKHSDPEKFKTSGKSNDRIKA